jgi:nuclear polyadenylated RNA-binding protein NAB2
METTYNSEVDKIRPILQEFIVKLLNLLPKMDDVNSIAEYIVLLITNGSSKESIVTEIAAVGINDSNIASDLIDRAFSAAEQLKNGASPESIFASVPSPQQNNEVQQPPQPQQQQAQQQPQQQPAEAAPQSSFQFSFGNATQAAAEEVDKTGSLSNDFFVPASLTKKRQAQKVLKNQMGNRNVGSRHSNQKNGKFAVGSRYSDKGGYRSNAHQGNDFQPRSQTRSNKMGRCTEFPNCPLPASDCPQAHPTMVCRNYPNCPFVNRTCSYLHPDEDADLIEGIKKNKIALLEKQEEIKRLAIQTKRQKMSGIILCKFGAVCTNPQCPYGHPTVINDDQKVTDFSWCAENLQCSDPKCQKAHASASKIRPVNTSKQGRGHYAIPEEMGKSLEQCKYNEKCTNVKCKFRHAKSHTQCRDGSECKRYDCIFMHPINELCKWGTECTNPKCGFQHPNGKQPTQDSGYNPLFDYTNTSESNDAIMQDQNQYMQGNQQQFIPQGQQQYMQQDQQPQQQFMAQEQQPQFNFNAPQQ